VLDLGLFAALDLGTNNCRLLVARPSADGFHVVDSFSRIVRLGEGVAGSGRLSEAAIVRTISALKSCADRLKERRVGRFRLIATEACRIAANGAEFLARVKRETGLSLEIIDRRTEAELASAGCAVLMSPDAASAILFDIGGGSTEIVWLDKGDPPNGDIRSRIRAWTSLPVGVVTLAEKHGGVRVDRDLYARMIGEVTDMLKDFIPKKSAPDFGDGFHLLGTSGTVTTVAALHLRLPRYDRRAVDGLWMASRDAAVVIDGLLDMSFEQRAANACIGPDRADLVLAGCAIYDAIVGRFPAERLRIADRGLREGILMQLMMESGSWHANGTARP
jgi:exopolyphosphatase/guanosine-5'-triphosphate,3'-diphosphate pyrophosphatase